MPCAVGYGWRSVARALQLPVSLQLVGEVWDFAAVGEAGPCVLTPDILVWTQFTYLLENQESKASCCTLIMKFCHVRRVILTKGRAFIFISAGVSSFARESKNVHPVNLTSPKPSRAKYLPTLCVLRETHCPGSVQRFHSVAPKGLCSQSLPVL